MFLQTLSAFRLCRQDAPRPAKLDRRRLQDTGVVQSTHARMHACMHLCPDTHMCAGRRGQKAFTNERGFLVSLSRSCRQLLV